MAESVTDVSLRLLVLKTHDVDRLLRFYESLGISFAEEKHGGGPVHFAGTLGETVFELYPLPADGAVDASTRLGFSVGRVDAIMEALDAAGGRVLRPAKQTSRGYMAVVADPDGRSVELYPDK
jgi:predicted enzyme related to lactoylglutathione lyase